MVIISHDRHFLSSVCTHMADVDYGGIRVYAGNCDDYMEASTLAKQQQNANARAKDGIADLEEFVRRFRAHKAKARQATSRMKQIEKLKVEDLKPSSRQYPFIRFAVDPKEKLHRVALEAKGLAKGYERGRNLFEKVELSIEAGEKVAIIGPDGIGKTTLLRCLAGNLEAGAGTVKWRRRQARATGRRTRRTNSRATRRSPNGWAAGGARTASRTTRSCARPSGSSCSRATTRRSRSR